MILSKKAEKELLFKGLTRPALFWGVPIEIMIPIIILFLIISVNTGIFWFLLAIPILWSILKAITKDDEFKLGQLILRFRFLTNRKSDSFYGAKTYLANAPDAPNKNGGFPLLSILGLSEAPSMEKFIPYSSLISDTVVMGEDNSYMISWKVAGVNWDVEEADEINANKATLNNIIKALAHKAVIFYVHTARYEITDDTQAQYDDDYLAEFHEAYYKTFKNGKLFENALFITMIYEPHKGKVNKLNFSSLTVEKKQQEIKYFLKEFEEIAKQFEATLKEYSPTRLSTYTHEDAVYSTQLEFYSFLLSGEMHKVRVRNATIKSYITGGLQNIQFGKNTMQLNFVDESKKFARFIELRDYGSETYVGLFNALMYLDVKYTITQSFAPLDKQESIKAVEKQKNQLLSSEDYSTTQTEELKDAQDQLSSTEAALGNYHFNIMVYGDTKKEVIDNTNKIHAKLQNKGFISTLQDIVLPAAYFSQLQTNYAIRPRVHKITSKNYSSLIALHNFPKGQKKLNCWGDAIATLKTPSGQPYYLNLHESPTNDNFGEEFLGNALIFGKSGGGKTAFLSFLLNMMMKYDKSAFPPKIPSDKQHATYVFLDKDKGALGNILAISGKYISVVNGEPSGFNPFMCESTEKNIEKLQALIKMLVTRNDETLTVKEEDKMDKAILAVMTDFEKEERSYPISLLLEYLTDDRDDDNSLKKRLSLWTKGKKFGWVFDNAKDELIFDAEYKVFGIDGTEYLDNPDVKDPIVYYLFWRIFELVDGRRFGLFIDEYWKYLEHESVEERVKDGQKTIRKKGGFILGATQSIEDVANSPIARSLVEQSATQFFFANQKAVRNDYIDGLMCTDEEYETIKDIDPASYQFLVKRPKERVLVKLDLGDMPKEYIKILSTGTAYIEKIEEIFAQTDKTQTQKVTELKNLYKG